MDASFAGIACLEQASIADVLQTQYGGLIGFEHEMSSLQAGGIGCFFQFHFFKN